MGDELVLCERGGKRPYQAAVITLSDKGSRGEREDKSGPAIETRLRQAGYEVVEKMILADEKAVLKHHLMEACRPASAGLILTTGGTGFSPRDMTREATVR